MSVVLVLAGFLLAGSGSWLLRRGASQLRRAGAFDSVFWASMREYPGYRLRALRPAGAILLGLALLAAGLLTIYLGITDYYTAHLGRAA
jgi:hypothetical protein